MHRELVYGIWDHIKNSGEYGSARYDLEYVAPVPGKRESRRLVGDYILKESDIVGQKDFEDTVGHGGWSIDLHALEGFFSRDLVNRHIILKRIYQIPYRTGYSRNIKNLFMAGRCMSTTHVAFGTTRVMATLSTLGQALGAAAYLCEKYRTTPRGVYQERRKELQQLLLKYDQYIVGGKNEDPDDIARDAVVETSSVRKFSMEKVERIYSMKNPVGLILPVDGFLESVCVKIKSSHDTTLRYTIYEPCKRENYNPESRIADGVLKIKASKDLEWTRIPINRTIDRNKVFLELTSDPDVQIGLASGNLTGVITMDKTENKGDTIVDVDTLKMKEFMWHPWKDRTLCFRTVPEVNMYASENLTNGYARPYGLPNIWLSDEKAEGEFVTLSWTQKRRLSEMILFFDSDLNYRFQPSENNVIPQIVRDYDIYCRTGNRYEKLREVRGNHQRMNRIPMDSMETDGVRVVFLATNGSSRIGLYEIRIYE